ncbi:hypothetical protein MAPG_07689 [Magnaporthiopsis poae ATCC 64411]|uniref:Uncharacterized protein n=1 Tax=Magnaporthiopsis poae (strain ATCC 64411 / 73-15) TaxID=644358 RepID=A0A0C4E5C3_MAGP6|nr:hypothetical protein MAPG_07689 [Magnaporthiopsis poae ATCC 64411]
MDDPAGDAKTTPLEKAWKEEKGSRQTNRLPVITDLGLFLFCAGPQLCLPCRSSARVPQHTIGSEIGGRGRTGGKRNGVEPSPGIGMDDVEHPSSMFARRRGASGGQRVAVARQTRPASPAQLQAAVYPCSPHIGWVGEGPFGQNKETMGPDARSCMVVRLPSNTADTEEGDLFLLAPGSQQAGRPGGARERLRGAWGLAGRNSSGGGSDSADDCAADGQGGHTHKDTPTTQALCTRS